MTIDKISDLKDVKELTEENKEIFFHIMTNFINTKQHVNELKSIETNEDQIIEFAIKVAKTLNSKE